MDRVLCAIVYCISALARVSAVIPGGCEKWEPGEKIRILLAGYNGARNTGSDVRVIEIARQVKELFGEDRVHITVMTLDPEMMEGYFDEDVEMYPFSTLFPISLYKACSSHHAAILVEGSTLKSTFANGLTLFLCEAAGVMGAQGKPCLAYGSEVGTMEPFIARAAARLCRKTYFITRTAESLAALKKLGLKGHAGTDAAWFYDRGVSGEQAAKLLKEQGWDGKKKLLGIAVIDPFCWPVRASLRRWIKGSLKGDLSGQYDKWYFYSESPGRTEAYRKYIAEITAGVSSFLENHDYYPVLIGMERLDEKACNAVRSGLRGPSAIFLSGDHPANIMTGILRSLSMLVTSRYHAAVLSMEKGCPIIAVSMDERLNGIMNELSLGDKYLFDVRDPGLGAGIAGALAEAERDSDEIRVHMKESCMKYKKTLAEMASFMKRYIESELQKKTQ